MISGEKENENEEEIAVSPAVQDVSQEPNVLTSVVVENYQDNVSVASEKSKSGSEFEGAPFDGNIFEKSFKSERSYSPKSHSENHSDEIQRFETKIAFLEQQTEELNKQLLNLQHLYSETKNENITLKEQVSRANECIVLTNAEMEQYRMRAQRILQEKEKLIAYKNDSHGETDNVVLTNYLEELR